MTVGSVFYLPITYLCFLLARICCLKFGPDDRWYESASRARIYAGTWAQLESCAPCDPHAGLPPLPSLCSVIRWCGTRHREKRP